MRFELQEERELKRRTISRTSGCMELRASRLRYTKAGPLGAGNAVRRRVRRIVGVGMGLPRHDGEAESVVMEDDAVLVLGVRGRAPYAQAHVSKRRGHHRVPRVL